MATTGTANNTSGTPIGYGTPVGLAPILVLPANPSCGGLIFINAGPVAIAICPAFVNLGANGVFAGLATGVPVIGGPGSVTMQPGDKFIIDNLLATSSFNGIAAGTTGVLTVWSF
jgi:hypothetical protein